MLRDTFWYGDKSKVTVMVKDPYSLFVFWHLGMKERMKKDLRLGVRLYAGKKGKDSVLIGEREVLQFSGSLWWHGMEADTYYRGELGIYDPEGNFTVLALSQEGQTPPMRREWTPPLPGGYPAMVESVIES